MLNPLIDAATLKNALEGSRPPLVLDCRARLGDVDAGAELWRQGHLPGSQHLDLDRDLAAPPGEGGRHPLPEPHVFAATLRRFGVTPDRPVVVYDDMGGQLAAARAWWMLACWAGHPNVRLLDGGLDAWQGAGGALTQSAQAADERTQPAPSEWAPNFDAGVIADVDEVRAGSALKLDARSRERFRGESEPVDPVAGHIPGARCRPGSENLDGGRFKRADVLARELPEADAVIAYCGSGVAACQTIVAYGVAGRPLPRLYVGSWSDWIRDASRPVATGD
ncbi:MAG TPA: sulfurtransferase [Halomonas sp.]|nr:sulfurtransferase [Halomonas sp.]